MDYCSSCRRHLNGALVCPGCGAYAPDIAPRAADGRPGPAAAPATAPGGPATWEYPAAAGTWQDGTLWDETPARSQESPGSGPSDEYDATDTDTDTHTAEGFEARPQGRAARRRQMARWKKNQRRAVVATAVALVGGGLTVAAMNGNAKPGVQAATTPQDTTMGGSVGEAPTYADPTSRQAGTPDSGATPATPPHTDRASRHQQPRAADPRTTAAGTRTDAAATPRELPLTTAPRRKTVTDTAGTATGDAASTASNATEPTTAPAAGSGSDAQEPASSSTLPPAATTPPETSPSDTKPKELCLLVICLG
ncbi:SCO2400 family protein [Streptomyces paradoxus]|uniref:SCO2400 family protein n=1 Tax=Streptomyces paradoxus TaxID=66375 RepID=UPI00381772F2